MTGSISEAVTAAAKRFHAAGVENPAADAWRLAGEAYSRIHGLQQLVPHERIDPDTARLLGDWFDQRERRRPVSQIVGRRLFRNLEFSVTSDVLDPRPESEVLVEAGVKRCPERILDLGTGSGCLLLSLLAELPGAEGVGIDSSEAALRVARENSKRTGLCGRARFHRSDWYSAISGQFDLIVSNPPYLTESEFNRSPAELRWEPQQALTVGGDGLSPYRTIAAGANRHLASGGRLLLEIGAGRLDQVSRIVAQFALCVEEVHFDLDRRPRAMSCMVRGLQNPCGLG